MVAIGLPAQPVDATQALNLSAGVSNCKVSRGHSRASTRLDQTSVVPAGVESIDENGGGPGVRLRKPQRLKQPDK
jgi:hypothetical protein